MSARAPASMSGGADLGPVDVEPVALRPLISSGPTATSLSPSTAPSARAKASPHLGSTGAIGRAARLLLALSVGGVAGCLLPPDFEVEPIVNQPTHIDTDRIVVDPDDFHALGFGGECPPPALELDINNAIDNPDDDVLTIVWFVNYESTDDPFVAVDTPLYTFDPCTDSRARRGNPLTPNKVEVFVFDRKPQLTTGASARTPPEDATFDRVTWLIAVDELSPSCCDPP